MVALCSCSHPLPAGVHSYDVAAARLCKAFEAFVADAKNGVDSVVDSSALDKAEAAVRSNTGPAKRWMGLANDVRTVLLDAEEESKDFDKDGLKVGQDCSRIPLPARSYVGFT
jgi:hypothetical protein